MREEAAGEEEEENQITINYKTRAKVNKQILISKLVEHNQNSGYLPYRLLPDIFFNVFICTEF